MNALVTTLLVGLLLAVVLLAVLVAGLLRSHAEVLRSLHELGAGREDTAPGAGRQQLPFEVGRGVVEGTGPVGLAATAISGTTPSGDAVQVAVGAGSTNTLVAFLSSGCLTCQRVWDRLADPAPLALPPATRLVVVTRDSTAESPSTVATLAAGPNARGIDVVMSTGAWEAYEVPGSPYFAYVDAASGRVTGEGSATDWEQVERLVTEAVGDRVIHLDGRHAGHGSGHGGAHREARADAELLAAGITPDHPSLRPDATAPDHRH
ncbi:hypothetical protein [Kineococcus rhizosphaerae]|uniref:Thioredoxin domain-containing protein n=1 Tax=Kineococcus rhizosphaerae TaxID=559628 RepID=A0A2T0R7V6_9ACTN|nr:hypothetical protein [Kineococcus rhizosphaerae]PRY17245.1 hypothetical protein CLV37_102204 [Kineococcus rhizosphaerae]